MHIDGVVAYGIGSFSLAVHQPEHHCAAVWGRLLLK